MYVIKTEEHYSTLRVLSCSDYHFQICDNLARIKHLSTFVIRNSESFSWLRYQNVFSMYLYCMKPNSRMKPPCIEIWPSCYEMEHSPSKNRIRYICGMNQIAQLNFGTACKWGHHDQRTQCALHVIKQLAAAPYERHFIGVIVGGHLQSANCRPIHQPPFPLWHSKYSSIDPSHDNIFTSMMYYL